MAAAVLTIFDLARAVSEQKGNFFPQRHRGREVCEEIPYGRAVFFAWMVFHEKSSLLFSLYNQGSHLATGRGVLTSAFPNFRASDYFSCTWRLCLAD
jgi:hypothetical protein